MKINLTQNAYPAGTFYRLPTEDGEASIYAMQGNWYEASAKDEQGNEYLVMWDILTDWDGEDGGDACNWDHPTAVVQLDPWRDVTDKIEAVIV